MNNEITQNNGRPWNERRTASQKLSQVSAERGRVTEILVIDGVRQRRKLRGVNVRRAVLSRQ